LLGLSLSACEEPLANVDEEPATGAGADEGSLDPDLVHVNGACLLDADCGPSFACILGACTPGCTADDECGDALVCDPHGICIDPNDPQTTPPLRLGGGAELSATSTSVLPDSGEATVYLTNGSDADLTYRLAAEHPALMFDESPGVAGPNEQVMLSVAVDLDLVAPEEQSIPVQVITDLGTFPWEVRLQPDPSGHYSGRLVFTDSYPLGHSSLSLNLDLRPGGAVAGQTFAEGSLMWPSDLLVHGSWEPNGEIVIQLADVLPAAFEEGITLDVSLGREVGRNILLYGRFDDEGTSIEGELDEHLTGLADTPVVVHGTFRLNLVGAAMPPSGTAMDYVGELPKALPSREFPSDLDQDVCSGLGIDYGTVEMTGDQDVTDACMACSGPQPGCEYEEAAICSEALLEHGYALEEKIQIGAIEVESASAGRVPEAWVECTEGLPDDPYPCLNEPAIRCAGALARYAQSINPTSTHARERVLDQLDKETTVGALLGTGHMVDAGLAHLGTVLGSVAEAELFSLDKAQQMFRRPLRIASAPGILHMLAELGPEVVRDQRGGRDLTNTLTLATQSVDAFRTQLRLRQRTEPAKTSELRSEARQAAAWIHAHGALVAQLLETYDVEDSLGELSVFGEAIGAMSNMHAELAPGNNPLGFSPKYVPMLLSAEHAGTGISNFELVLGAAQPSLAAFKDHEQRAIAALEEYEQAAYDALSHYASLEEGYDSQLIVLCGIDPTDPAKPNLDACGQSGGQIQELRQQIEVASVRVQEAQASLQANHQAIEVEEDRFLQVAQNAADLEVAIEDLQGDLFAIMGNYGAKRSVARTDAALAECGRIQEQRALDTAVQIAQAVEEGILVGWQTYGAALGAHVVTGIAAMAAENSRAELACESVKEQAELENTLEYSAQLEQQELMVVNQEIDRKVRESTLEEKRINSEAEVRRIALAQTELSLRVDEAMLETQIALERFQTALELAGSLVARRERAKRRLQTDPSNPYLNPAFLVLRNELGKGLSGLREETLRWLYRAGRAIEFEMNMDFPAIETRLYPARSSTELGAFAYCLQSNYSQYKDVFGSPQQHVTEISLREDVFGITGPIIDPVTNEEITEAEQFVAVLTDPDNVLPDGTIELRFALPLVGDTPFGAYHCNDRIESQQVKVIGDYLGDNHLEVLVGSEGASSMRRCDAEDLALAEAITTYNLGRRRVVIQAGVNDWGTPGPNGGLAGWPVSGDQWVVSIPSAALAPANADLDPLEVADVIVRFAHRVGTVSSQGETDFSPVCG